MKTAKLIGLACTLALLGCKDDPNFGDTGDTGTDGGINLDADESEEDDSDIDADGASGSTDDGPLTQLDCERIDFVFVVDNSSSMADEQEHLVKAVPGFVDAMQTALPDVESIRVGVVDTDTYPALGTPDPLADSCPEGADCDSCDYTLGALMTKPNSALDPEASCGFSTGAPYMDGFGADFVSEFECAALVGTEGNPIEQQAGALLGAVSPELNDAGACNEGFVRDDALLVFLMISDEEDDFADAPEPQGGSQGEPEAWFDAVVAAKDGKMENVVALGLIGGSPRFDDCSDLSQGLDGAEQTTRLEKFVGSFENKFTGSVCSEGYDAFFNAALEEVSEGCRFFIP